MIDRLAEWEIRCAARWNPERKWHTPKDGWLTDRGHYSDEYMREKAQCLDEGALI